MSNFPKAIRLKNRLIVLTGGPGSGKTTLLNALAEHGYTVSPEAGRAVIQAEMKAGGLALPWVDQELFAQKMLAHDLAAYHHHTAQQGLVFFDRGIPDLVGYRRLSNLSIPADLDVAVQRYRYANPVFVAPFWPEIYKNDAERKQSPEEALKTYEIMRQVYETAGYNVLELPKVDVKARIDFVLAALSS